MRLANCSQSSDCAPSESAFGGIGMHLDEQPVRAGGDARDGNRRNEPRDAHRVRRIDDDRQVRHLLEQRHDRDVEHVARRDVERSHAALAEHDAFVAAEQYVFGGQQPLLHRRRKAALQQHGHARLPTSRSSGKFCMLRAPICSMSA